MSHKSIKIGFQVDNPASFNLKSDTSYALMKALKIRGYEVFYYQPQHLRYDQGSIVAKCKQFGVFNNNENWSDYNFAGQVPNNINHFGLLQDFIDVDLQSFNTVFIRQNPPFDMAYITSTYLLDIIKLRGVRILNDSTSIRNFSEKICPLEFSQFMPKTLITSDFDAAKNFHNNLASKMILKPLYGHGGDGVFCFDLNDKNLFPAFDLLTKSSGGLPIICQQYVDGIETIGDKRIFLINGELLFVFARTQAPQMNVASSVRGGGFKICKLTDEETEIVSQVGARCKSVGLNIVGLDVIGGKYLTEINVTSPTGVLYAQNLYNQDFTTKIVDSFCFANVA